MVLVPVGQTAQAQGKSNDDFLPPIVFLTSGLHVEYHTVADAPATIDYEKLARVARLMYESGRALGDRAKRR